MSQIDFVLKLCTIIVLGVLAILLINAIRDRYKEDFLSYGVLNQVGVELIALFALVTMLAVTGCFYVQDQAYKLKRVQDQIAYIKGHYEEKQYYVIIKNWDNKGISWKYVNADWGGISTDPYVVDKRDATSYDYKDAVEVAKQVSGRVIEK